MSQRAARVLRSLPSLRPRLAPLPALASTSALPQRLPSVDRTRALNTVNEDEIAHFSRLSQHWWDETGEFALLHRMNPERVEYVRQKVALDPSAEPEWTFEGRHGDRARAEARGQGRWLKGLRVLDVGCGGGLLAEVSSETPGED